VQNSRFKSTRFGSTLASTRTSPEVSMTPQDIILIGAPVDSGKERRGCLMGPDAYRTAGLAEALMDLGHRVSDTGNLTPQPATPDPALPPHVYAPAQTAGWTATLAEAAQDALQSGLPVFLGGDHSLSLGSVAGAANHAAQAGRPQFVLWLDAHSDFHTPQTTASGNLHGTPLGYVTGRAGFHGFPPVAHPVPEQNICILGLRSVDAAEREALQATQIRTHDMRVIDEQGISRPLGAFLDHVAARGGALHVSLDVDFLDPSFAPAVGTTVPGGATIREAHLVMEMICDSGLMTSLDLVELNPFLDDRGRTAQVMVDLAASALGRRVFDRPTLAYS
jgi:arginase